MNRPQRWPLHPRPGPLESLSSYMERLAACYDMHLWDLLACLGMDDRLRHRDLDTAPPAGLLAVLAEHTGVELAELTAMTLPGWAPWLFDVFDVSPDAVQPTFDAYVRGNSVLLAPGEAGSNRVASHRRAWQGPWMPLRPSFLACPACAADPARGSALVWQLALMTGCAEHGCRLEDAIQIGTSIALSRPPPGPVPLQESEATVDRYTYQALTTGRVNLPGRTVHAGIWFRLLRAVLDELTVHPGAVSRAGRSTLRRVWAEAGLDERAGLSIWRPYEHLDPDVQQALRRAAGIALHLVAGGIIDARGLLAATLRPPGGHDVYAGDPPDPAEQVRRARHEELSRLWAEAERELQAWFQAARTDPDTARRLWGMYANGCRTPDDFERENRFLIKHGIPAAFLPTDLFSETGRAGRLSANQVNHLCHWP